MSGPTFAIRYREQPEAGGVVHRLDVLTEDGRTAASGVMVPEIDRTLVYPDPVARATQEATERLIEGLDDADRARFARVVRAMAAAVERMEV